MDLKIFFFYVIPNYNLYHISKITYFNEIQKIIIQLCFYTLFYKTALYCAVEKGYKEIVKILVTSNKIDVDICNILKNKKIL